MKVKKKVILGLALVLIGFIGFIGYGVYVTYFWRTPEKILEQQFSIELKNFDYSVDSIQEQWSPNGDGFNLITFKFNRLTQEDICYFKKFDMKPLPIPVTEEIYHIPNDIPKHLLENADKGYYLYKNENTNDKNSWSFKIFIIDTEMKTAVLYYQFM